MNFEEWSAEIWREAVEEALVLRLGRSSQLSGRLVSIMRKRSYPVGDAKGNDRAIVSSLMNMDSEQSAWVIDDTHAEIVSGHGDLTDESRFCEDMLWYLLAYRAGVEWPKDVSAIANRWQSKIGDGLGVQTEQASRPFMVELINAFLDRRHASFRLVSVDGVDEPVGEVGFHPPESGGDASTEEVDLLTHLVARSPRIRWSRADITERLRGDNQKVSETYRRVAEDLNDRTGPRYPESELEVPFIVTTDREMGRWSTFLSSRPSSLAAYVRVVGIPSGESCPSSTQVEMHILHILNRVKKIKRDHNDDAVSRP